MKNVLTITGIFVLFAIASGILAAETTQTSVADPSAPSARIIGGFQTSIDQIPATVALLDRPRVEIDGDLFQAQFCGGTVIAARWVLTAAHCVISTQGDTKSPDRIFVLTGSTDLDNPVNQPIAVQRIIVHPEYQRVEQGRDIALLQLEYDALVEPIALDTLPVTIDESAFIAGWGAVNPQEGGRSQSFPKQLRGAFVNMTPGASCGELFPAYSGYTDQTMICAGVENGGKDSCQGDSGGPLYRVSNAGDGVTAITGITSWGISCGLADNPGIYTSVSAYVGWIQGNLSVISLEPLLNTQPLNDGSMLQSATTTVDNAVVTSTDDGQGRVFAGVFWAGLLPLAGLLCWRKRCNLRLVITKDGA